MHWIFLARSFWVFFTLYTVLYYYYNCIWYFDIIFVIGI